MQLFPALDGLTRNVLLDLDGPDPGAEGWEVFAAQPGAYRLAGLALRWAREHEAPPPDGVRVALSALAHRQLAASLLIARRAEQVQARLAASGIDSVVVKGPSVSRWYPVAETRAFGDVDLLVHPRNFAAALRQLRADGYDYQDDPDLAARRYFQRQCWEGVNLVHPDLGPVDLHHHLGPWYFGRRLTMTEVTARAEVAEVHDARLTVADPVTAVAVTVLHLVASRPPGHHLVGWRDLVELMARCDPDDLRAACARWRVEGLVASVTADVPAEAWRRPPPRFRATGPPRRDAFRLRHLTSGRTRTGALERTFGLPAGRAALYAAGQVVPSRRSLQARFGEGASYPDLLRRAGRDAVRPTLVATTPGPGADPGPG